MKSGFCYRRLVKPLLELLQQGVSPEKLALSVALGAAFGIIPVLGSTTALCALIASIWGLNLPAIQIVNYFVYPLQIALILPFFRLGERIFRAPHLPISVPEIYAMARGNLWGAIQFLWSTTWHAIVVWAIFAPFLATLLYLILVPSFRRLLRKQTVPLQSAGVKAV